MWFCVFVCVFVFKCVFLCEMYCVMLSGVLCVVVYLYLCVSFSHVRIVFVCFGDSLCGCVSHVLCDCA